MEKEKKEVERKIIKTGGQRDFQKIINESLSNEYLNYLFLESNQKIDRGQCMFQINPSKGMPLIGE